MPFAALQRGLDIDLSHLQVARRFEGHQGGKLMKRAPEQLRRCILVSQDRDFGFDKRMIDDGASGQKKVTHVEKAYMIRRRLTEDYRKAGRI